MFILKCHKCKKDISQNDEFCPYCKVKVSVMRKFLHKIENNRIYFMLLVILAISLLGIAWFLRLETGHKWIIYVVIITLVPLVPWILKTAYGIAAPINSDDDKKDNG